MRAPTSASPTTTTPRLGRALLIGSLVALAFAIVWYFDAELYRALAASEQSRNEVVMRAWYQCLRSIGYAPLWVALGLAVFIHHWPTRRAWHGFLIGFIPPLAGGVGEALQHAFRRLKPRLSGGVHQYQFFSADADVSFGFPSSHAAVAFGGAFIILFLFPRAGIVAVLLAIGCAWTRVLQGGHFVTDVFASALIGYALAWLLRPRRTPS